MNQVPWKLETDTRVAIIGGGPAGSFDELYASSTQVEAWLGQRAHVFLLPRSGLVFGSLVPKGSYINVSV